MPVCLEVAKEGKLSYTARHLRDYLKGNSQKLKWDEKAVTSPLETRASE